METDGPTIQQNMRQLIRNTGLMSIQIPLQPGHIRRQLLLIRVTLDVDGEVGGDEGQFVDQKGDAVGGEAYQMLENRWGLT